MSVPDRFTGLKNALVKRLPHQQTKEPTPVDTSLSEDLIEPLIAKVEDYLCVKINGVQSDAPNKHPQQKTTEQTVFTQSPIIGSFDLSRVQKPPSTEGRTVKHSKSFLYPDGQNKTTSVFMLHGENVKLIPDRQRSHEEEDLYPRKKRT